MATVAQYGVVSSWFTSANPEIVTGISWSSGDIIIVVGGTEAANYFFNTPTNANLTFTQRYDVGTTTSESRTQLWTAQAGSAQTNQTISAPGNVSAGHRGIAVYVVTGGTLGIGVGAANITESALSLTVGTGSVVIYHLSDWNASNSSSGNGVVAAIPKSPMTGSGTATERYDTGNGSTYAVWGAQWVGTSAGTYGFGPNHTDGSTPTTADYTGLKVAQVAIEITDSGSGTVQGAVSVTDVRDSAVLTGTSIVTSNSTIAVTDGADQLVLGSWLTSARSNIATATTTSGASNALSGTDGRDTAVVSGKRWSTGSVAATDSRDSTSVSAKRWSSATLAATDSRDTAILFDFPVVVGENTLSGEIDAGQYTIGGAGDLNNQGFARQTSINAGETLNFAIHGDCQVVTIYRVGHYGGNNWREVTEIVNTPTTQGNGTVITDSNGATSMANWTNTASWAIPSTTVSGLFVAVARNAALNNASWIPFVVRNDDRVADIVIGIPTSTWGAAYNYFENPSSPTGGRCLYGFGLGNITDRSFAVSYDRPIISRAAIVNHWDNYESAVIDWFEENGYNVKYVTSEDLHGRPATWNDSSIYISVGHDEYWSQEMRDNVEAFRNAGGHCLFMSANEVFWKIRYSPDMRTIWCYKDTMPFAGHTAGAPFDPVSWTGTWRDTRWVNSNPESYLTGTFFRMNGISWRDPTISSATYGSSPFWRNTSVVTTNLLLTDSVGFEADEVDIPDARQFSILAGAVINIDGAYADDNGQNYSGAGSLNPWGIVMHQRAASEGVVVGFGTMAWSWMLSDYHRDGGNVRQTACQQATVNLLSDLGAQAYSLRTSNLTLPTPVAISAYGIDFPQSGTVTGIDGRDSLVTDSWLTSSRSNEAATSTPYGTQTWTGTASVLNIAPTSNTFVPGAVSWTGTSVTTSISASSGLFTPFKWPVSIASVGYSGSLSAPGASGTGWTLSGQVLSTTASGARFTGLNLTNYQIQVNHDDAQITNCLIANNDFYLVQVFSGGTNCLITDCTFDNNFTNVAVEATGCIIDGCLFERWENAVRPGPGTIFRNSVIRRGFYPTGPPHYDGVELFGGENDVTVYNCVIFLTNTSNVWLDDTGAINLTGTIDNFCMYDCLVGGGSSTLNFGTAGADTITNTRIGVTRAGISAPVYIVRGSGINDIRDDPGLSTIGWDVRYAEDDGTNADTFNNTLTADPISDPDPGNPSTWTGNAVTLNAIATSGVFTPGDITWPGVEGTLEILAINDSFASGLVQLIGTPAVVQIYSPGEGWSLETWALIDWSLMGSGFFVPGSVNWTGTQVSINLTFGFSQFVDEGGPQTWTGTNTIIRVTPADSPFASSGIQWLGTANVVGVTTSSGTFVSGASVMVGSLLSISTQTISGDFASSGTAVWVGTSATIQIAAQSNNFVDEGGPQVWDSSTSTNIFILINSGSFIVSGTVIWLGEVENLSITAGSESFSPGTAVFSGNNALINANAESGIFVTGAVIWAGTAILISTTAISSLFVSEGSAQTVLGVSAGININPLSGSFTVGSIGWSGNNVVIDFEFLPGEFILGMAPQELVGSEVDISIAVTSNTFAVGTAGWTGNPVLVDINVENSNFEIPIFNGSYVRYGPNSVKTRIKNATGANISLRNPDGERWKA